MTPRGTSNALICYRTILFTTCHLQTTSECSTPERKSPSSSTLYVSVGAVQSMYEATSAAGPFSIFAVFPLVLSKNLLM